MFEPNGETEQRLGRARVWAFDRLSMLDQAFHSAEAGCAGENPGVVRHRHRRRAIAFDFEGNHPTKQVHLSLGKVVLLDATRVPDNAPARHFGCDQETPRRAARFRNARAFGRAAFESRDAPASNRTERAPRRRPTGSREASGKIRHLLRDQCAAQHVAMAAKIFRGRMHDQIRAEREWSLDDGRPCVVANRSAPGRDARFRPPPQCRSVSSVGLEGVSTQTIFVFLRDRLFERDEIGHINEIDGQLPASKDATRRRRMP